jgi:hypothetical protein
MHVVICIIVDAFVHFMHLHVVSVVCVVVHNTLVPPICACTTLAVSIVTFSSFDAPVLFTHFTLVCVLHIIVLHHLVSPVVQLEASSAYSQFQ